MTTREIQDEILRLKKEKDVCILAHAYQNHEILEVADYMGDSFALSQQAAKTQEQPILMCGVRFMAETVKVLSPDKKVLLSSGEAGCPMAEQLSVEELKELKKQYPEAHIIRFDFDTTRNKNTHLKLLKDFEEHKADIMLGTQMIAKGLDFSNVTFVGVLMADLSLMVPDFRASERTFQLLCQVAGRSGRGEKQGTVMIQTFNPEHYAIKAAVKQDYDAFFKEEIAFRKKAKYPPYCHLVSVIVQSRSPKNVHSIALDISQYLKDHLEKVRIIGPQSTFKMQDIYRERILIKYIESKPIYEQLSIIDDYYNRTRKGGVIVECDFNPYSTY